MSTFYFILVKTTIYGLKFMQKVLNDKTYACNKRKCIRGTIWRKWVLSVIFYCETILDIKLIENIVSH